MSSPAETLLKLTQARLAKLGQADSAGLLDWLHEVKGVNRVDALTYRGLVDLNTWLDDLTVADGYGCMAPDCTPSAPRRHIVGFTGRKYAGKDTAASGMGGYMNVKFAGALKAMLEALLLYQGVTPNDVQRMLEGDLKERPTEFLGGRSPRHAMQTLGTEWGRDLMAQDLWLGTARRRMARYDKVAITDIRFENEVALIRELGGKVYRIERPGVTDTVDGHPSEALVDSLDVDGVIVNDFISLDRFADSMGERAL